MSEVNIRGNRSGLGRLENAGGEMSEFPMQDYKSLRLAVMIYATLVNTDTHTRTYNYVQTDGETDIQTDTQTNTYTYRFDRRYY